MSPNPVELRSFVYVGGWDWSGAAYPFRAYELDRARGTLSSIGAPIDAGPNPSYVGQSLDGRFLYIANEYQGRAGVTVAAVDTSNGTLRIIDSEPLAGEGSYVFTSIDPSGGYLLAANINAGKAAVYPVTADGTLGAALDIETFGDDAETHSIRVHPSGRWAYAPNKKADQIAQLHFDASTGKLSPNSPQALATTHRGPRHLAFSPDGSLAYVSYETDSVLGVYRVETNGTLTEVQTTSTLPAGFAGANTAAHVLVHPRGGFVYCSNRGHDSIAVFSTGADGRVSLLQHIGTQGKVPRHFDIDSQGELLVVANQGDDGADNGTLTVFSIGANGMLSPLGSPISGLPSPTTASIVTVAKL